MAIRNTRKHAGQDTRHCSARTEVYSRVCGFFRPVQSWNRGKRQEFAERVAYALKTAVRRSR